MAYATLEDLQKYLGDDPGAGAQRQLERASDLVDAVLVGAIYDTDTSGDPTDAAVIASLRSAVCAQVEYWIAKGDELGLEDQFDVVELGSARLERRSSQGTATGLNPRSPEARLAPRARDFLITAGLWPGSPYLG